MSTTEKIFFKNSKGDQLCGILSNPASMQKTSIAILCHGFSTSKDGRTCVRLEKSLNEKGLSTFRFDFFGHGESGGKFEDITISEAVDDIKNAIHFLKASGYKKMNLVGSSFGGMASLIAASKTNELNALALKSPVSDYLGLLIALDHEKELDTWREKGSISVKGASGENLKLNYSFYEDALKVNGYQAAKKIRIATMIVHGKEDITVPLEQSIKTSRLIKDCRLEVIDSADHVYSRQEDFEKMLDLISEFIFKLSLCKAE